MEFRVLAADPDGLVKVQGVHPDEALASTMTEPSAEDSPTSSRHCVARYCAFCGNQHSLISSAWSLLQISSYLACFTSSLTSVRGLNRRRSIWPAAYGGSSKGRRTGPEPVRSCRPESPPAASWPARRRRGCRAWCFHCSCRCSRTWPGNRARQVMLSEALPTRTW